MVQLVPCATVFTPANTSTSATTTSAATKIRAPDIIAPPPATPGAYRIMVRRAIATLACGEGEFGKFRLVELRWHGSEPRVGRQPAVEEAGDPALERRIVEGMHGQMHAALLGAG